jgi:uncharacterized surface protein with fasciclin (FAS1) repeats
MHANTLNHWKALSLMLLLMVFTSATIAGDKARSKLPSITDIAATTEGFEVLYAALETAGLDGTFDGKRHFTVFAPTDAAFSRLLEANGLTPADLLGSGDLLVSVLKYHVTRGDRLSGSVVAAGALKMLDRNIASVAVTDNGAMIDDAVITTLDIKAKNGVVHVIDTVLIPPGAPLVSAPPPVR